MEADGWCVNARSLLLPRDADDDDDDDVWKSFDNVP